MPKNTKLKRKRAPKKRVASRRKYRRSQKKTSMQMVNRIGMSRSPFPLVFRTALTYSQVNLITQAVATIPQYITFRANSLFDPDLTGVGHQPRYYDSLCAASGGNAPYNAYRVIASKIQCLVFPTSGSGTDQNCLVSVMPVNDASYAPNTIYEMRERPYAKFQYITTLGSYKPYKVSNYCKMAPFLGIKDIRDSEDTLCLYNANPVAPVQWTVSLCALAAGGYAICNVLTTITYYVEFSQLNDVADS